MNYQAIKYWNNRGQRSNFEIGGGGGGGGRGNDSDSIWGGGGKGQ